MLEIRFNHFGVKTMKFNHKIIIAGLALSCLTSFVANAQPDEDTSDVGAILFRIENIVPLANKDGITDQCAYTLTVYNRMDKGLRSADLQLTWTDNVSGKYQINGDNLKVVGAKEAQIQIAQIMTIDNVAPHSQKSFAQKVNTDKCYLLLNEMQYSVKSCSIEGQKMQTRKDLKGREIGGCSNNFNYIDSKNPEYYTEFKDIPASALAKQVEEEKERELSKVNATVEGIITSLDNANKELEKIK